MKIATGLIKHRILLNYKIDAQVMQSQLPDGFEPQLVRGFAIGGICQVSLAQMRPQGVPALVGMSSDNAAHRVAVVNPQGDLGVLVLRRDTNSWVNVAAGGRLFPGYYSKAEFSITTDSDEFDVTINKKGTQLMKMQGKVAESINQESVFNNIEEVSQFFMAGNRGWSPPHTKANSDNQTKGNDRYDTIDLVTRTWNMQPLKVKLHYSGYFMDERLFPQGSVQFDSAMVMQNIQHSWVSKQGLSVCK